MVESKIVSLYSEQPWLLWLLICLCRQEKRQAWLKQIHTKIQNTTGDRKGTVPGHPQWSYRYHGIGLCLTGPNDETLDADFRDEELRTIDPYFFTTRIFGLSKVELPEERLRHWLPREGLVVVAIKSLQHTLLEPPKSHSFRLNKEFQVEWDYLNQLDDYTPAEEASKWQEIEDLSDEKESARYKASFQKWLLQELKKPELSASGFEAIAHSLVGKKKLEACLVQLRHVDHKMAAAVKVLFTMDSVPIAALVSVFHKLNPKNHHPYLAHTVCAFLLSRNEKITECIKMVKSFAAVRQVQGYGGNPFDYHFALQLLTYSPNDGVPLIRMALRSDTPYCVERAAALMAAIDQDWSYQELIKVLTDHTFDSDKTQQRYIVAGLLQSEDAAIRKFAKGAQPLSSERREDEHGYTLDEVVEHKLKENFKYYVELAKTDLQPLDIDKIRELMN